MSDDLFKQAAREVGFVWPKASNEVQWYREAWGDDFKNAPPCPKTEDGKHQLSLAGTWCQVCGLRGRVEA